jgi:hypothetical protein
MWISPHYQDGKFQSALVPDADTASGGSANAYYCDFARLSLEDKIAIFVDRTEGWQLGIAEQVSRLPHSDFAVLHIVLSYFETIAKYYHGIIKRGDHKGKYFKTGVRLVFPTLGEKIRAGDLEAFLNDLYSGARCGLYHASLAAGHIEVCSLPHDWFKYDAYNPRITIDPPRLVKELQVHVLAYTAQLRNPSEGDLRANFEKRFNHDISLYEPGNPA